MNKNIWKIVGSFAAGLVVGAATGYLVSKKGAELYYAEMAAQDIHEVKEHYRLLRKEDVVLEDMSDQSLDELADLQKVLDDNGYSVSATDVSRMMKNNVADVKEFFAKLGINDDREVIVEEDVEESVSFSITNVFNAPDEDPYSEDDEESEYKEAVAKRNPEEPYVIHVDEYMDPDNTHDKYTITFYEGDETLVDESNKVIPDVERLVGADSLTMFGKFSNDTEIVYVRNERNDVDFEIIRDEGSYVDKMLGVPKAPIQKMRGDD